MARIALVGCGGWGKNLARNLSELGALSVIVDPAPQSAELAASLDVRHCIDIADVLRDPLIDGVAIATPAATHFSVAERALRARKDVFVEKPISLSVEEGVRLSKMADDAGRILMVGHLLQYHPVFLKLKALVTAGDLGRIRHISSSRLNLGMIRTEENVVWSFAPHDISMVLGLAGQVPTEVAAVGTTVLQEGIPDIATIHMNFDGGLKADVTASWLHPQKEQKLIVVGDDGMAVFSDTKAWEEKLCIHRNKVAWIDRRPKAIAGTSEYIDVAKGEPLKLEMQHFLDCIKSRSIPRTDAAEATRVLAVLQSAQKSLNASGAWLPCSVLGDQSLVQKFRENVIVHESAVIDDGVEIGAGTKIWHFSHVLGNTKIGERCSIGQNVMIGPDVSVGSGCKIQNNVAIYKGVTLADDVFCGPSMVFTNVLTPRAHVERKDEFARTTIGRGATLGANCTIVCGNDVGSYAMIGAGAVVTKDVPAFALVVGNPARRIGWVSAAGERLGEDLICPRTKTQYRLEGPNLIEAEGPP
jgi:UDP-2-acetamido-3-amino-2,3-dideoxy-glucuronate N-acetyltransferase